MRGARLASLDIPSRRAPFQGAGLAAHLWRIVRLLGFLLIHRRWRRPSDQGRHRTCPAAAFSCRIRSRCVPDTRRPPHSLVKNNSGKGAFRGPLHRLHQRCIREAPSPWCHAHTFANLMAADNLLKTPGERTLPGGDQRDTYLRTSFLDHPETVNEH